MSTVIEPQIQHSRQEAMARRLLRWVFKGRLITRSLPADLGGARVCIAPESALKHLKPGDAGLDPLLLRFARDLVKPDTTVWDIGANVGVFSFAAAGRGARVLSVEPDPFLANALLKSRAMNPAMDVRILMAAISDRQGVAELSISSGGRASNALSFVAGSRPSFGTALETVMSPTLTLDSLLETNPAPAFVKIDIEGAELAALHGAARLLKEARPIIAIEVALSHIPEATDILRSAGYALFDTDPWMRGIDLAVENTIAIPAETFKA